MTEPDAEQLRKLIEQLNANFYALRAEHLALLRIVEENARSILPAHNADALMGSYAKRRDAALEQMILALGDTHPEIAEALQKLIDQGKGGASGTA
ncbi:MAG TPA: hypothetical protein VK785_07965 [Opitutaceae bacterium]|jgi:hypothetical protein|nr:hypothetical protein [Opitutaceae bacterium]